MLASNLSLNLVELGHFCAYLAMMVALLQGVSPIAAHYLRQPRLAQLSVNASAAVFLLTTIGGLSLIHAFVTSNFSVQYVATNSNSLLPIFYKVAALWGGHEGSLYLWVWILTLYTLIVGWRGRRQYPEHLPPILAVQGWLIVGFFGLILFLSNPFDRVFPAPPDGNDLNPLLQDPGMVFHPPLLYLGYVGFSVPFAFAMTALLTRWRSELWIGLIRRWTLIAWGFLTTGILLGGWWAYYELGWGGYWAWDPVENASFMPWLLGTALVHSITVQDRRRMLHTWNIFLVISTFSLSLLGTFLVRSGVLSSVHAFAVDPGRGAYILAFMTVVLAISFGIFMVKGRYQQAEEEITSLMSRESLFVWNNVLFTVACGSVLLATLYPLALDAFSGQKITVAAQYFNAVMVPLFLALMLLMAVGPLVPWRKAKLDRLRLRLLWPFVIGIATAVSVILFFPPVHWTGPVAAGLALFAFSNLVIDYARAVSQRRVQLKEPLGRACYKTVLASRRHYGGMTVHFGIVIIALGLTGSGLFRTEATVSMAPGDVVEIAGERLRFEGVRELQGSNYQAIQGRLTLLNSGRVLLPERRRYMRQEAPMTETSIDSTMARDVYVVLAESSDRNKWAVHVYVNPLVRFIWTGGFIILLGILLSLSVYRRSRAEKVAAAARPAG
ncbi:MAG: heme lyase CcmF/NrfE family subunit [Sulfuricaulis sp.]|uniref:heme lyase CcmF/NrfE family subunit n=1 Tax=Sulfuricaulis sp. TaxID=2003553 RepID=UPI0034A58808